MFPFRGNQKIEHDELLYLKFTVLYF